MNRIARWYIQKDDEVRLLVGRDDEKYEDPRLGPAGGWKVYKVKDVAFKTNRVYLEGLPVSLFVTLQLPLFFPSVI